MGALTRRIMDANGRAALAEINASRAAYGAPRIEATPAEIAEVVRRRGARHEIAPRARDPLVGLGDDQIRAFAMQFAAMRAEYPDTFIKFGDFVRVALFLDAERADLEFPG